MKITRPDVILMNRRHRVLLPNELRKFVRAAKKNKRFSLEFAFNTGLMPLELVRVATNLESMFNEDECSISIPDRPGKPDSGRTVYLTETFSDNLAINLDRVEFPMETVTIRRRRVVIPKYQAWIQWYKRLSQRSGIENPEDIRLVTNRYTWGYYLFASGIPPSTISEQLRLSKDAQFYRSFTLNADPVVEDIEKYTHDWKGNI